MRPMGVTAIAILTWLRGCVYALAGLAVLGVGHLGVRMIATAASDTFLERIASGLTRVLGIGALSIAAIYALVGVGLWWLKNWARTVTLVLAAIWLAVGLSRLIPHPTAWHIIRPATDALVLAYLLLPDVRRAFAR